MLLDLLVAFHDRLQGLRGPIDAAGAACGMKLPHQTLHGRPDGRKRCLGASVADHAFDEAQIRFPGQHGRVEREQAAHASHPAQPYLNGGVRLFAPCAAVIVQMTDIAIPCAATLVPTKAMRQAGSRTAATTSARPCRTAAGVRVVNPFMAVSLNGLLRHHRKQGYRV
jgi:hypothetical protein